MLGSAAELDRRAIRLSRTPAARKQHDRINAPDAQTASMVEATDPAADAGVSTAPGEGAGRKPAMSGLLRG
jgi:hypothetical protein